MREITMTNRFDELVGTLPFLAVKLRIDISEKRMQRVRELMQTNLDKLSYELIKLLLEEEEDV